MPTCWCRTIPEAAAVSGARCAGKLFRHPPHPCQRGTCGTLHGTYVCGDRPAPTSRTGQIDAGDQTFRRQSAFPDDANRRQLRSEAQRMPAVHDLHLTRMGKRQPRKPQFALIDLDPAFPDFGMGGGGQLKADLRLMILVPASWIEKPLASDETVLWCTQPKRLRYPSWDATMCQPRPLSTRSRLADALCDQLKAPDMTLWSAPQAPACCGRACCGTSPAMPERIPAIGRHLADGMQVEDDTQTGRGHLADIAGENIQRLPAHSGIALQKRPRIDGQANEIEAQCPDPRERIALRPIRERPFARQPRFDAAVGRPPVGGTIRLDGRPVQPFVQTDPPLKPQRRRLQSRRRHQEPEQRNDQSHIGPIPHRCGISRRTSAGANPKAFRGRMKA